MLKKWRIVLFLFFPAIVNATEPFEIRGVLPWHNFLCGPSAWNETDYEQYLDRCREEGINLIGFHNYTGGGERYATYVEPMIRISYDNIVPQAYFDNSTTCRWGYIPLERSAFPFGSDSAVDVPQGADAFGSDVSVLSRTPEEHYRGASRLMQRVLKMAHERKIRMAMGFEFGVVPPEYFSLHAAGDCFFWLGAGNMIPNPCHPVSTGLHYAALDDLLDTYPEIDYVWLWLNEHSFLGVDVKQALKNPAFAAVYKEKSRHFREAATDQEKLIGVWALQYIEITIRRMHEKGSKAQLVIGGWGGGNQLPSILRGLDRALPQEIIFSCLNPALGTQPQPEFLEQIARHRDVWGMPWLEGDHQLWHYQPRVDLMKNHVQRAFRQGAKGVVALHWRTEETRYNLKTFARFAANPADNAPVEELYKTYFTEDFGAPAAQKLASLMSGADIDQLQASVGSPEYYAFTPEWGRLDAKNEAFRKQLIEAVNEALPQTPDGKQRENLQNFKAQFAFELLLNEVVRAMAPGWELRRTALEKGTEPSPAEITEALKRLETAPAEPMIRTYASKVRSRGEMGVLSSVNQRLWNAYLSLKAYLTAHSGTGSR